MKFIWEPKAIETELKALEAPARHLWVASAYFSDRGLDMVQDLAKRLSLSSREVTIILSDVFSENHPADVLRRLGDVARVWLVNTPPLLHAKVVLVHSDRPTMIFGSANLTEGGLERNIEFSALTHVDQNELDRGLAFFKHLQDLAIPVTAEVIAAYEKYEQQSPPRRESNTARVALAAQLKALQADSSGRQALGNPGRLLTAQEVRELTRVNMPRGRLRYSQPVSKPGAAYIVTQLGAEGDDVDPPDQLIGDTLYLTDQKLDGYSRQVVDLHRDQPDVFPLWVVEQVRANVYRSLGLATITEQVDWNGASRWLLKLSAPCNVFPAPAKAVCDKALSAVAPSLRDYLLTHPVEKDFRYAVERAQGIPRRRRPAGNSVKRWLAAGPIAEAEWIHTTVQKHQGERLLHLLYPSKILPRPATRMVRTLKRDSDVILLEQQDLLGVTADRWNSFLGATLESFLRHNGMID